MLRRGPVLPCECPFEWIGRSHANGQEWKLTTHCHGHPNGMGEPFELPVPSPLPSHPDPLGTDVADQLSPRFVTAVMRQKPKKRCAAPPPKNSSGFANSDRRPREPPSDVIAKNREIGRLKRELSEVIDEESPEAQTVKALLDLWWREVKNSDPRVKHDLKSTRAPKVRKALKRRGAELCQKAILGVKHDDWAMGRIAKSGGKDFNDIAEHIFATDASIEKFAKLHDDRQAPAPVSREPESLAREFVRHVYDSDETELPYRPASKEPKHRPFTPNNPVERVLTALSDYRPARNPDEWEAICPAHDDTQPSLVIRRNADGMVWIKCWAGCSKESILESLGLEWRDLWERSEHDTGARNYAGRPSDEIAPHLRQAMHQLLAREEREAA